MKVPPLPVSESQITHSQKDLLTALKAAGDDTRLRLLVLLSETEHNVKDLTEILGQSQPRLSRHLKLLTSAGLIERFQEGAWVYYRRARKNPGSALAKAILGTIDNNDIQLKTDQQQAEKVLSKRVKEAQSYFKSHAKNWDEIRSLYVREEKVEKTMQTMLGNGRIDRLIDLGTGTGRILELFASQFKVGIGIDINHEMLRHARARLSRLNITSCELRRGDITSLDLKNEYADTIIMHQILHFFADPAQACLEAARILKPGGKLLIVDFAPHEEEQLRTSFAHQRLGFEEEQIWSWLKKAGLKTLKFKTLPKPGSEEPVSGRKPKSRKDKTDNALSVSLWLAGK